MNTPREDAEEFLNRVLTLPSSAHKWPTEDSVAALTALINRHRCDAFELAYVEAYRSRGMTGPAYYYEPRKDVLGSSAENQAAYLAAKAAEERRSMGMPQPGRSMPGGDNNLIPIVPHSGVLYSAGKLNLSQGGAIDFVPYHNDAGSVDMEIDVEATKELFGSTSPEVESVIGLHEASSLDRGERREAERAVFRQMIEEQTKYMERKGLGITMMSSEQWEESKKYIYRSEDFGPPKNPLPLPPLDPAIAALCSRRIPIVKAGVYGGRQITPESLEKLAAGYEKLEPCQLAAVTNEAGKVLGEVCSLTYADGVLSADLSFPVPDPMPLVSAKAYPAANRLASLCLLDGAKAVGKVVDDFNCWLPAGPDGKLMSPFLISVESAPMNTAARCAIRHQFEAGKCVKCGAAE